MRTSVITLLILISSTLLYGQKDPGYETVVHNLNSEILNEERQLELYLPPDRSSASTTIYLLDGEWNFEYTKGLIDLYKRWNRIPDVALVAITNTNRTRDFSPTEDSLRYPGSGGAEHFLEFIAKELIPSVEKEFNLPANRLIVGHSFGGLMALYTLMQQPELFSGYISISPSTWWKDQYLFDAPAYENIKQLTAKPFLYLSSGEFDRGNTTHNKSYLDWLEENNIAQHLEVHYDLNEGENHFTNVAISLQQAFNEYWPGPEREEIASTIYFEHGLDSLKSWNSHMHDKLQERFISMEDSYLALATSLHQEQKYEELLPLLQWVTELAPDNGNALYFLGAIAKRVEKNDIAKKAFEAALEKYIPERMKVVIRKELETL